MSVPNQKVVFIHKANQQKAPFVTLNLEVMSAVYKELGYTAFYLYLILCGNADGFRFEFSPQAILNNFGMPVSTTNDQVKKLIAKGFLIQRAEGSNLYDFYAEPEWLKAKLTPVQPPAFDFDEQKKEEKTEQEKVAFIPDASKF